MHPTDRAILEHCVSDFRTVAALKGPIPSGRLYRHIARLMKVGWLEKQGSLYLTTEAGRRQLADATRGNTWDVLVEVYPPLALVPTPVHRALSELIMAAMVARHHQIRPDRHPFFVAFGSTLRWKTSLGRFICHAVGLDPAVQVVDCGSEAGRSLTFRRGSDGTLVSKRALLETPFVVLDEFQLADRGVRSTLGIFLGGRLVMPVENEQLTVRPVPLLTLNPKEAPALETRLGLSPPLIRRALIANLDAVPLPDLAAVGERAVDAARTHPALVLASPRSDVQDFHDAIVDLVRSVLLATAHERIDVEIVATLCAGMTAFIAEPVHAIAQVVHGVAVLAEILGWARPGWIEVVSAFKGVKSPVASVSALARVIPAEPHTKTAANEPVPIRSIPLSVPPSAARRRTSVPELDLSDELRARIIWFAMETRQDVEVALTTLLDFFLEWRDAESTIETLAAILRLAQQLELVEVKVETLHGYLKTLDALREKDCDFEDVPEALRLITVLQSLPRGWTWEQADFAIQAIATMLEAGIDGRDVTEFLERHRQLEALGFDEATAVAVAEALTRDGITGDQRDLVLASLVELAGRGVEIHALEERQEQLQAVIAQLETQEQRAAAAVQARRHELQTARETLAATQRTKTDLDAESHRQAGALAVVDALRAFLAGKTMDAAALGLTLKLLLTWHTAGGRVDDSIGKPYAEEVRKKIFEFFQELIREISGSK